MEEEVKDIADMYMEKKDMVMTEEDQQCFKAITRCHICNDQLGEDKVCDQLPTFVSIVFHNLTGYDANLFVRHWELPKVKWIAFPTPIKSTLIYLRNAIHWFM